MSESVNKKGDRTFPFRWSEQRRAELKILATRRKKSVQALIEEGLALLERNPEAEKGHRFEEELNLLLFILHNGSQEQCSWITGNLRTFKELILLQQRLEEQDRASPVRPAPTR